MATAISKRGKV